MRYQLSLKCLSHKAFLKLRSRKTRFGRDSDLSWAHFRAHSRAREKFGPVTAHAEAEKSDLSSVLRLPPPSRLCSPKQAERVVSVFTGAAFGSSFARREIVGEFEVTLEAHENEIRSPKAVRNSVNFEFQTLTLTQRSPESAPRSDPEGS